MSLANTGAESFSLESWEDLLGAVVWDKVDLNALVIDYLATEGFAAAADCFRDEAAVEYEIKGDTPQQREEIRKVLHIGDIERAIALINDLNPEILDNDAALVFSLKRQQFIEFVREGKIEHALLFAEQELAPRIVHNESLVDELETIMSLFAFDKESLEGSPVAGLLDDSQRQVTASDVNSAILSSIHQDRDSKLKVILQQMLQSQTKLAEKISFPTMDLSGVLSLEEEISKQH